MEAVGDDGVFDGGGDSTVGFGCNDAVGLCNLTTVCFDEEQSDGGKDAEIDVFVFPFKHGELGILSAEFVGQCEGDEQHVLLNHRFGKELFGVACEVGLASVVEVVRDEVLVLLTQGDDGAGQWPQLGNVMFGSVASGAFGEDECEFVDDEREDGYLYVFSP